VPFDSTGKLELEQHDLHRTRRRVRRAHEIVDRDRSRAEKIGNARA
jgi:hypothetical protein